MASTSSRSESPADIDFSVIRTSIQMGHKMIDQILNGVHYGSEEVRNLLREECDFILECKVCRNLFRSFPNFVAHKRVYCMEYYEERRVQADLAPVPAEEETVIIQPEAPEEKDRVVESGSEKAPSNLDKAGDKPFEGKSKEYQFYTRIAEEVEMRKATKVTNTVILTPIPTSSKAVVVTHSKGDKSDEIIQTSSPKKQSPVKSNQTKPISPDKKNTSVLAICANLANKKVLEGNKEPAVSAPSAVRVSTRCRKSSPRKSIDYLEEDREVSEIIEEPINEDSKLENTVKDWRKYCDIKKLRCKPCRRSFNLVKTLKYHALVKHVNSETFSCPICPTQFAYNNSLFRHLKRTHHKSEAYVCKIKAQQRVRNEKPEESMETDQEESSAGGSSPSCPQKVSENQLSCTEGWKKCDKCGKVCWKAKSFYRHYTTCKGSLKEDSKSITSSPVKSGNPSVDSSTQKNTTALIKLQEKLRAGVIQPSPSVEAGIKNKRRERNDRGETEQENKMTDKVSLDVITIPEMLKGVTKSGNASMAEGSKSKGQTVETSSSNNQVKTYNLRAANPTCAEEKTETVAIKDKANGMDKEPESQTIGSPAFKKLEERLVREAGLKEIQLSEKTQEVTGEPLSGKLEISSTVLVADDAELKGQWIGRNLFSDPRKDKDQRIVRESPEIKELEKKLTRDALGHNQQPCDSNQLNEKDVESKEKVDIKTEGQKNDARKSLRREKEGSGLEGITPQEDKDSKGVKSAVSDTEVAIDVDTRKRNISERFRERTVNQESVVGESKSRSSRSVSREDTGVNDGKTRLYRSVSRDKDVNKDDKQRHGRLPEKTPEKVKLATNFSPVSSPTASATTPSLPSSPTPSLQSNSGDGYNMKFKMTVQEMAELVESASLTKFAKDRKKKARNILNTKQAKESQRVAAGLSKPMKRRYTKRKIVIRNVYGTRNKASSSVTQNKKFVYSTRAGASEEGSSDVEEEPTEVTEKSDQDSPVEVKRMKRLSREQKRLLNSEGFVEKNFYAVGSSRDSSKDAISRDPSNERPSKTDDFKETPASDSKKQNLGGSVRNSLKDKSSRDPSRERPLKAHGSKDSLSSDSKKENPASKSANEKLSESISKDRQSRNLTKERSIHNTTEKVEDTVSEEKEPRKLSNDRSAKRKPASSKDSTTLSKSDTEIDEKNISTQYFYGTSKTDSETDSDSVSKSVDAKERLKTVLYVGKDFTERIKCIQEMRNVGDQKKATEKGDISERELVENETNVDKDSNLGTKVKNRSASSERHKTVFSPKNISDSEDHSEDSSGEVRRNKKSAKAKLADKDGQGDSKIAQGTTLNSPKHRTRLATGSIFFDSELLKLSPTKFEKKAAELSNNSETHKSRLTKGAKLDFNSKPKAATAKLSLSPRKETLAPKPQFQGSVEPKRYSLSTGVKQCQKCNKKFWKKRAYMYHMTNSPCADKKNVKGGKKRALSLSPQSATSVRGSGNSDCQSTGNLKKVKTETKDLNKSVDHIQNDVDMVSQSANKLCEGGSTGRERSNSAEAKTTQLSDYEGAFNEFLKKRKAEEIEICNNKKIKNQNPLRRKEMKAESNSSVISPGSVKESFQGNKQTEAGVTLKGSKDQKSDLDTCVEKEVKSFVEDKKSDKVPVKKSNDTLVEKGEVNDNGDKKLKNKISEIEVKATENKLDTSDKDDDSAKQGEFTDLKAEKGGSKTVIKDEIPGPSTSFSSVFTDDSEDDGSDFSGFSEDDLRIGEEELSNLDTLEVEEEELEDNMGSGDDDLVVISDDSNIEDDTEVDADTGGNSPGSGVQRPVRKSAQNRFAHVEEIWVYKEPGKACVSKNSRNREYVVDWKNPSKLQCHNYKDVDKLVDEQNVKCLQCDTPCTNISNLRRHVIRHLGWKRYKCKHCTYTCYDMSYCRQHTLRAHDVNLNSKNFSKFITDLKKEATKKRSAKRTSTLHKSKLANVDTETNKKQKNTVTNKVDQKGNLEQTSTSKTSKVSEPLHDKSVTEENDSLDSNKVVMREFIGTAGEGKKVGSVTRENQRSTRIISGQTHLDKARHSLFKALHHKK